MTDLQGFGVQVDTFVEESPLRLDARIAGEEHAKRAILQEKCDRVIVDRHLAADEGQRRTDERQYDPVIRLPHRARARIDNWHAVRMRGVETIVIRMTAVRLPTVRDFRDA